VHDRRARAATANCIAGRVSTTIAPSFCNSQNFRRRERGQCGRSDKGAAPRRFRSTSARNTLGAQEGCRSEGYEFLTRPR
jgi:hypothetical protein